MISGGEFKLGMAYLPGESHKPKLIRGDDFPSGKKHVYLFYTMFIQLVRPALSI